MTILLIQADGIKLVAKQVGLSKHDKAAPEAFSVQCGQRVKARNIGEKLKFGKVIALHLLEDRPNEWYCYRRTNAPSAPTQSGDKKIIDILHLAGVQQRTQKWKQRTSMDLRWTSSGAATRRANAVWMLRFPETSIFSLHFSYAFCVLQAIHF